MLVSKLLVLLGAAGALAARGRYSSVTPSTTDHSENRELRAYKDELKHDIEAYINKVREDEYLLQKERESRYATGSFFGVSTQPDTGYSQLWTIDQHTGQANNVGGGVGALRWTSSIAFNKQSRDLYSIGFNSTATHFQTQFFVPEFADAFNAEHLTAHLVKIDLLTGKGKSVCEIESPTTSSGDRVLQVRALPGDYNTKFALGEGGIELSNGDQGFGLNKRSTVVDLTVDSAGRTLALIEHPGPGALPDDEMVRQVYQVLPDFDGDGVCQLAAQFETTEPIDPSPSTTGPFGYEDRRGKCGFRYGALYENPTNGGTLHVADDADVAPLGATPVPFKLANETVVKTHPFTEPHTNKLVSADVDFHNKRIYGVMLRAVEVGHDPCVPQPYLVSVGTGSHECGDLPEDLPVCVDTPGAVTFIGPTAIAMDGFAILPEEFF